MQVKGIVVGEGFRFGYRAKGDTAVLSQLCTERGLSLAVVPLLSSAADPASSVSSSKVCSSCVRVTAAVAKLPSELGPGQVRAALAAGDMELVETFLDRPVHPGAAKPCSLDPWSAA